VQHFYNDPKHPGMLFAQHLGYTCVEAIAFNITGVPHLPSCFQFIFFVHYLHVISRAMPGAFVGGRRERVEVGGGR